jgi:hypothetical protein
MITSACNVCHLGAYLYNIMKGLMPSLVGSILNPAMTSGRKLYHSPSGNWVFNFRNPDLITPTYLSASPFARALYADILQCYMPNSFKYCLNRPRNTRPLSDLQATGTPNLQVIYSWNHSTNASLVNSLNFPTSIHLLMGSTQINR